MHDSSSERSRPQPKGEPRWDDNRFRLIVEATPNAMVMVDARGQIVLVNSQAERLFGYSRKEMIGQAVEMLLPEERRGLHEVFRREFASEPQARPMGTGRDLYGRRKDGTDVPVEVGLRPIVQDEGLHVLSSIIDITERKRSEQALRDANHRLEVALAELASAQGKLVKRERLSALGQMASGIAHDFNNALAPIVGFTELILESPDAVAPSHRADLRVVHTAACDAVNVVRRLREFYRPRDQQDASVPVDLVEVVEQAIAMTQPKWKDEALATGVSIRVMTDLVDVPVISGDPPSLREVLVNLILNAIDAMPSGGTLSISTQSAGEVAELRIRDTGTGMTPEVRDRCFEPFFTTKGERGSGLGLALVHGVVRRHSGTIDLVSEVGKGTEFTIRIPTPTRRASPSNRPSRNPARPLHVLVVDDEFLPREVLVRFLSSDGHTCEVATNGREGLDKFHAGSFDLVVTDSAMPDMNGEQLVAAVRAVNPEIPIVMVSGFGDLIAASGKVPPGVTQCLGKPVTLSEWRKALDQLNQDKGS